MALVDGVSFLAASSGTGTFVFSTARSSFLTLAQAQSAGTLTDGQTVSYLAQDSLTAPTQREWGHGTYSQSGNSIARTTVLGGSNGTSPVSFSVAPIVSLTALAEDFGSSVTGANPTATAGDTAVNGSATTFMRSDAAPAVQKGSATAFGIVKVDNITTTASSGVISAVQQTLPTAANPTATAGSTAVNGSATTFMRSDAAPAVTTATTGQLGLVKPDGTSITISGGTISAAGGGSGSPGGSSGEIQFNNSGAFGGAATASYSAPTTTYTQPALTTTGSELVTDGSLATDPSLSGWTLNDNIYTTGQLAVTLTDPNTGDPQVQIPVTLAANTWYVVETHMTMTGDTPYVGGASDLNLTGYAIGAVLSGPQVYKFPIFSVTSGSHSLIIDFNFYNAGSTRTLTLVSMKAMATAPAPEVEIVNFEGNPVFNSGVIEYSQSVALGEGALASAVPGTGSVAIGQYTLNQLTTGQRNVAIGAYSMCFAGGTGFCVGVGQSTLVNNTGTFNVAVGSEAMYENTTGHNNVAVGPNAMFANTTGNYNVAVGEHALLNKVTGDGNVALGYGAGGTTLTDGADNILIGFQADVPTATTSNYLNIGGAITGDYTTGPLVYNVPIAFKGSTSGEVTVAAQATAGTWTFKWPIDAGTNTYVLQTDGSGNTSWVPQSGGGSTGANPTATAGPTAVNGTATTFMRSDAAPAIQKASATQFGIVEVDGTSITATGGVISATGGGGGAVSSVSNTDGTLDVSPTTGNVIIGIDPTVYVNVALSGVFIAESGGAPTGAVSSGLLNLGVGENALGDLTAGQGNLAFGNEALRNTTVGSLNVAIGTNALFDAVGTSQNVAIGSEAMANATTAQNTVAIGFEANQLGDADRGVFIGSGAGQNATGQYNTFVGTFCANAVTSGAQNTIIGAIGGAPSLVSGSGNVFIGAFIDPGADVSDCIIIGTPSTPQVDYNLTTAGTWTFNSPINTKGYTVATLPAAGTAGRRAYVTDALAPTFLGTLTGGHSTVCPVFDNGTAWVAG